MNSAVDAIERGLVARGWDVSRNHTPVALPETIRMRYPWLPIEVVSVYEQLAEAVSPEQQAWLIGSAELHGDSDSAFAWNQWECDSLEAAEGDASWSESIRKFWNAHLPLVLSVRSGYAYLAIREDFCIVGGEGPEFEEITAIADSFAKLLAMIGSRDQTIERYL